MQPANPKRPSTPSIPAQGSQQVATRQVATPAPQVVTPVPQRDFGLGKRTQRSSPSPDRDLKYQARESRLREPDVDTLINKALGYLDGQKKALEASEDLHVQSAAKLLGRTLCMASPFNQGDAETALSIFASEDKKAAHYSRSLQNEDTSKYSDKVDQADAMAMVQRAGNLPDGKVAKVGGVANIATLKYYEAVRAKEAKKAAAQNASEGSSSNGNMGRARRQQVEADKAAKKRIPLNLREPLPSSVREESTQGEMKSSTSSKVRLYNQSLDYRVKTAEHVMNSVGHLAHLNVKMYNDYPAVMVHFDASKFLAGVSENASLGSNDGKDGFSHFLMSRYTGIVNAEAAKMGLDVPTVERSSFGHATPSIAPTDESFRINLGTMLPAYAEAHIKALQVLNAELGEFQTTLKRGQRGVDFQRFPTLVNSEGATALQATTNLMSLALTKVESENTGKSLITHAMRKTATRNFVDETAYHSHLTERASTSANGAIHDALTELFDHVNVAPDKKVSTVVTPYAYNMADTAGRVDVTEHGPQALQTQYSEYLQGFSNNLAKIAEMDSGLGVAEHMQSVARTLHLDNAKIARSLDTANQLLTLYTLEKLDKGSSPDVGYGSDSDIEEDGISGKKITTHNGMRSLLLAVASRNSGANQNLKIFYDDPYYELEEAVSAHLPRMTRKTPAATAKIIVKDINACVNNGAPSGSTNERIAQQYPNAEVWIIDPTSAKTTDMYDVYKQFEAAPNAKQLVFASSGLKNEQGGADINNYGTMRVFAKSDGAKGAEAKVMEVIGSVVGSDRGLSLFSHKHRRTMQRMGLVPTNKSIVTGAVEDMEEVSAREGSPMNEGD